MLASYEVSRASKYFGSGLAPDLIFIYGTITVFGLAFQLIQLIRTSHYVPYGRHMSVRNPCIPKAHTRLLNICTTEVEHQGSIVASATIATGLQQYRNLRIVNNSSIVVYVGAGLVW